MTVRRNSQRLGSLDAVIENLPERFYTAKAEHEQGTMTGLAAYVADLTQHLQKELESASQTQVIDVMTTLGIPPSEWYRAVLRENHAPA